MNKLKRILCVFLSVCVVAMPLGFSVVGAGAVDVSTLQEKLEHLEERKQEYQDILEQTQSDIEEKEAYNEALVNKIDVLEEKIDLTRESIEGLTKNISHTQEEIDRANDEIEEQVDALCERLRAIYMAGSASDLEIILGAKDFSDFIDKVTLIKTLTKYDRELIDEINGQLEIITEKKESLESDKKELEENEASMNEDISELNQMLQENQELLEELHISNDEAREYLANSNDEQSQIEAEIAKYFEEQAEAKRKAEEAAKQQAETQKATDSASKSETPQETTSPTVKVTPTEEPADPTPSYSSGYEWPTPGCYYVTAWYGEDRGTYGHGAIDIGASMGSPIVAADSGTVLYTNTTCIHNWGKDGSCGCGGGYGNYVWISHGNGKESIYAHMTSVYVSPGEYVTKGQVIGTVGSTGWSSGSHLHFETRYYGVKYDPMTEF